MDQAGNTNVFYLPPGLDIDIEEDPDCLVSQSAAGNIKSVRRILQEFPNKLDEKHVKGVAALHTACLFGHQEVVKALLEAGANVEIEEDKGNTPLVVCVVRNKPSCMRILLSHNANKNFANKSTGCTSLGWAAELGREECGKILLEAGCDVNSQDKDGDTPIHDAIRKGEENMIRMLVSHPGIDFTLKNKKGFNVLHHAALVGNASATQMILQKAPGMINDKKVDGFTALHVAAINLRLDVARVLVQHGADLNVCNSLHHTPLHVAVVEGSAAIIELLVTKGADVDAGDEHGNTALHYLMNLFKRLPGRVVFNIEAAPKISAIRSGFDFGTSMQRSLVAAACLLAQHGANLFAKDNFGRTPLHAVQHEQFVEAVLSYVNPRLSLHGKSALYVAAGVGGPGCTLF